MSISLKETRNPSETQPLNLDFSAIFQVLVKRSEFLFQTEYFLEA